MYPSTHASANLPLSFGVTNSVRQKGAAPLALSDILQLVTTIFHALNWDNQMEHNRDACTTAAVITCPVHLTSLVDCVWNVMAQAQKPYFVFRQKGQVHLNRRGLQFSWLLTAEVCASAVVMLDTPCSEVVWRVLAIHSIRQFPLHFPSRASPCAITFRLDCTRNLLCACYLRGAYSCDRTKYGLFQCYASIVKCYFHYYLSLLTEDEKVRGRRMPQSYCFLDATKKPQQSFPIRIK